MRKSGRHSISLVEILWFTRSHGAQFQSLTLASDQDEDDAMIFCEGNDEIIQHWVRLVEHVYDPSSNCWETVSVVRFFKHCRVEQSIRLIFTNSNAMVLQEAVDHMVKAIQAHSDDLTAALSASAAYHKAVNQQVGVELCATASAMHCLNSSADMVSSLAIQAKAAVDDFDMLKRASPFPQLVHLYVRNRGGVTDQITDRGMRALFSRCPLLKSASFGNAPGVTKLSLLAVLENKLYRLRNLDFDKAAIKRKDIKDFRKLAATLRFLPAPTVAVVRCHI